uniref:zinc finger protein 414-like isoform X2 n=1 Tax=Pristiophorus japonicus TaxID=55135 RepID=UPI00398E41D2
MSLRTEPEKGVVATSQSMEGKVYKCCANDCNESFSSMHHLVNHMRVHHKPNRYFKCEVCKLRFRTHRSLFKHLHVCFSTAMNTLPQKLNRPTAGLCGSIPGVDITACSVRIPARHGKK